MSDAPSRAGYKGALFAGSTGKAYRLWRQAMRNYLSGQADKSGSSCADHIVGLDMGGANNGAPALPAGAGAVAVEMAALRLVRALLVELSGSFTLSLYILLRYCYYSPTSPLLCRLSPSSSPLRSLIDPLLLQPTRCAST